MYIIVGIFDLYSKNRLHTSCQLQSIRPTDDCVRALFIYSFSKNLNCHNLDNILSGITHQFNSWQVLCQNDSSGCMWMLKISPSCRILGMVSFFAICLLSMEPSRDESTFLIIRATLFIGWRSLTSAQNHLGIRMIIRVVLSVSYENMMISRVKVNPLVGH